MSFWRNLIALFRHPTGDLGIPGVRIRPDVPSPTQEDSTRLEELYRCKDISLMGTTGQDGNGRKKPTD